MNKEIFEQRQKELNALITNYLFDDSVNENFKKSAHILLDILNKYSFESRLRDKGWLSRVIVDSLELDYFLAEEAIKFDQAIK